MQYIQGIRFSKQFSEEICKVMRSWKKFCRYTVSEKQKYVYNEDRYSDAGYEIKVSNQMMDRKENFHVNLRQYSRLVEVQSSNNHEFIDRIPGIMRHLEPIIIEYAGKVERETGISGLIQEVLSSKPYWTIRYLHYLHQQNKENPDEPKKQIILAKSHIDKHGFTVHLSETEAGVEILSPDERVWQPITIDRRNIGYIMDGAQIQLRTENRKKAVVHRVVSGLNRERYSLVCFVPLIRTAMYNKSKYGSIQSCSGLVTYDLGFTEFRSYFSSVQPSRVDTQSDDNV